MKYSITHINSYVAKCGKHRVKDYLHHGINGNNLHFSNDELNITVDKEEWREFCILVKKNFNKLLRKDKKFREFNKKHHWDFNYGQY